jgi:hypothetical protein
MFLPVTSQQCFFIALCFFMVVGFVRGWCREVISLVFVLLAVCLIHPDTSNALNCFLGRSGYAITYLGGASQQLPPTCSSVISFLSGAFWSLLIFVFLVALGYLIGNRLFPQPRFVLDRFFGIVPAIISGSFILFYLSSFLKAAGQPTSFLVNVQQANPNQFVPVMFVIVIVSIILALIAACFR